MSMAVTKLNRCIPYDPAIALKKKLKMNLFIYSRETKTDVHRKTCT